MTGKVVFQIISVTVFVYMILIAVTFMMHITITERINDICYDVADTISTEGTVSSDVYHYLCENVSKYGDCTIQLLLKDKSEGRTTYYFGTEEIIDVPLERGDRVIISVACLDQSLLERLTGSKGSIATVKTAVIG